MEYALFSARATRCGGCAAAAGGVSVAVMEQWEFPFVPFVPSVPFQPASGSWLMACGDFFEFSAVSNCPARARSDGVVRWCPRQSHESHKRHNFAFAISVPGSLRFVSPCNGYSVYLDSAAGQPPLWPAWPSLTSFQSSATSAISSYWSAFGQVVSMMVGTGGRTE